jgi:signal transduction histidine kinase
MRLSHIAITAIILAGVLAWLWSREMNEGAQTSEAALRALDAFVLAESELHRDVLSARAGMLRNYDSLVREDRTLRGALQRIPDNGRLTALVEREEDLTEQFKSRNALLQNSLAYFEVLSSQLVARQGPLSQRVTELTGAMLQLTLDTSPGVVTTVDGYLTEISAAGVHARDAALMADLLAHAKMLRELLPNIDGLLKSLFAVPSGTEQAHMRDLVLQRQRVAETHAGRARYTLIACSTLLLALLVHVGLQLRARALTLRQRAAMEHMIAGISTRFIKSHSHEITALIEQALRELAEFIQADRAYLLVEAAQIHLYKWCRAGRSFPPGWPEGAMAVTRAASVSDRGVIKFRDVGATANTLARETLSAAGVTTWLCIPSDDGEELTGLLAFDCVDSHIMRSHELGLLRMALDAMFNAVERRDLERDRARLEANLQHAHRMETIGALSSGIAHNFNNIVGAILGFTESAQLQLPEGTRVGGSLIEIRRAGERARDLVDQILTFGRRRGVRRVRISVQEWINEARSLLEATLPPHVRLLIQEISPEVLICGELASLQQVILNICNNAAQAMDSPGTIEIKIDTRQIESAGAARPADLSPGRYVVVCVTDPGRGMDEATLERVFEPFFTTRSEGNGLGLAMVRETVSEHGGAVRIRSTLGMGTHVDVWLPCLSAAQASAGSDVYSTMGRGSGETVLVLEANHERLLGHEEILAALGYEPVGFTQGADAEAAYLSNPKRFDAALYCARLQDGSSVLAHAARLREKAPHLPILLASSAPGDFVAPALADAGVSEIIRQPLNSAELAGALARCLSVTTALRERQVSLQS